MFVTVDRIGAGLPLTTCAFFLINKTAHIAVIAVSGVGEATSPPRERLFVDGLRLFVNIVGQITD